MCSGDVSMRHCVHRSRDEADLLDNEVTGVETTPHWMSPPAAMASMKAFVTDSSLGPKLLINLLLVMPMPLSLVAIVELILSGMILM